MTNFSISPTPLQVIGTGINNDPLTVQNTGKVSIYISADPGVSPSAFEYKIDPGGDFIWPTGKSLSVCTGPGVVGQISYGGSGSVHVNSGSTNVTGAVTINGSVPISGPVTVSGTVAISGGTVAVSGPVTVAGTVGISGGSVALSGPVAISGGVSVTGSTITVGTPVKLANSVTVIGSFSQTIITGTTIIPLQGPYDISAYSSVFLQIYNNAATAAPTANNWIDVLLTTGGVGSSSYIAPQFLATTGPLQQIQIPVTGTRLFVNISTRLGAGLPAGTFFFVLIGSGEVISKSRYLSQGDGMLGSIPQTGFYGQNFTTTQTAFLASRNGNAMVNFTSNSGTIQTQMILRALNDGALVDMTSLLPTLASAGNSTNPNFATFPLRPISVTVGGSAGFNGSLAIVQEG